MQRIIKKLCLTAWGLRCRLAGLGLLPTDSPPGEIVEGGVPFPRPPPISPENVSTTGAVGEDSDKCRLIIQCQKVLRKFFSKRNWILAWVGYGRSSRNFRSQKVWDVSVEREDSALSSFGHSPTTRGGFAEIRECSRVFSTPTMTMQQDSWSHGFLI